MATEMIEGVTAVALQGQTKKGGSFHLGEVKLNLTHLMFEKKCIFYSTKVITVDPGTFSETIKR